MFRCQQCFDGVSGQKMYKKVLETRPKEYPQRKNQKHQVIDAGGEGHEIVKEISICKKCYDGEQDELF